MTRINRMVMHGFKSFARRTELLFGDKFNCVLGPNGSGKSNVLDSLCFVLGRTSSKSLRAEKSANLIYNGGKKNKPSTQGEVSIYFDNSKSTFPTEDNEIKVTRIVRKNGQSVYKINDKTMTRQQIVDLLSVAKINPDGFNIILQGDIVRFVEMSSIERRQVLEEISGIGVYEEKKHKALSDLAKVDERLKEADIVLAERQTYLKELKKERDHAQKYKELSNKVSSYKASLLDMNIKKKQDKKHELEGSISELRTKLDKTEEDIKAAQQAITDKKKIMDALSHEIEEKGEKEQVALHKEVEQLKVDLATNKAKIENCRNEIARIRQRKEQLESDKAANDEQLKKMQHEKAQLGKEQAAKAKEQELIEQHLEKFRKKKGIETATDIDSQIEAIDREAEQQQHDMQKLREQQQNLLREKDRIEFEMRSIDERMQKVKAIEDEHKQQIDMVKQQKQEFRKAIMDLNKALTDDTAYAQQTGNAKKKLAAIQEELARLNARQMAVRERTTGNMAIKKIIEQKHKLQGIYGTVADLGNVAGKYSLALEVAAGQRLNSIVVSDDKVAAHCIKYLKETKLGVATFIPLNKIKPPVMGGAAEKLKSATGCHGMAIDIITFDSKFKKVFEHVFGDTLVVDDINVARRLGIGNARMATLDGDLAEHSGVMRGGFRQHKGIGFQEKELTKDIMNYEKAMAELESTIHDIEKKRSENEGQITKLRAFKANLEGEIIKQEKALHLDSSDLDASKAKKDELKKRLSAVEKELDAVMDNISGANKGLAASKIRKQELRNKIGELRNPAIMAELNAFNEKKRELRERAITLGSEIKNQEAQMEMIMAERAKIEGILKQHAKEGEHFEQGIKAMQEKIRHAESELKNKEKAEKAFYAQFKALFNRRSAVSDEISSHDSKIAAMREISRSTEIKMNGISLEHAKVAAELAGLLHEFSQYEGVQLDTQKSEEQLRYEIGKFERMVSEMSAVNMKALEIYDTVENEYNALLEKKKTLEGEKNDVALMIQEIDGRKKDLFMNTFDIVNKNFKQIFSALSTKGDASLVIEDPGNIFEQGLRIMVRLTGNKYLDIRSLSGGEKTMTALAFIFAIQEHEPHSFYVLDEVDAALDKHNSEKLAKLIRQYCERSQYIVISHNDSLIGEADILYGVSMNEHGMTQVTSLKM